MTPPAARPRRRTVDGYEYDVFLSYSRAEEWPAFVDDHFRPIFNHWLGSGLGGERRVFQDVHNVNVGQRWPLEIARGLAASRVMVPLLSRHYLRSDWCRREFACMLRRARTLRDMGLHDQVIFPVAIHDAALEDLPAVMRSMQILYIHEHCDPFMHRDSPKREVLSQALQPLCELIAQHIRKIPAETYEWPLPDYDDEFAQLRLPSRPRRSKPVLGSSQ